MLCPSCHTQNRDNARFCKGCGLSFTPEMLAAAQQEQVQTQVAVTTAANGSTQETPPAVQETTPSTSQEPVAIQPQETTEDEKSPNVVTVAAEEDISTAPTQILSPEQMLAYHMRRWQQETSHDQQAQSHAVDIADAPTLLIHSNQPSSGPLGQTTQPESGEAQPVDVSQEPTVLQPIVEPHQQQEQAPTGQPQEELAPVPRADSEEEQTVSTNETASASKDEENMEQGTPSTSEQVQTSEQSVFPALTVGNTVAGRYEIAQVLSEAGDEHIYQVTDKQGYKHCWNCGSEQNAEGDDFCIDCGAELANAVYTLHEYRASDNQNKESHVIQGTIINTFVENGHTYVVEQPQETQSTFPTGVHLLAASDSDAGNVRRSEPNEDSTLVLQLQRVHESMAVPVGAFIVSDGMGGHANGQGASRMTIGTIAERINRELFLAPLSGEKTGEAAKMPDEDTLVNTFVGAIQDANTALCEANQREKSDMGATITGFMIVEDLAYIINVGDSRTYLLRDRNLYQLTNDHSLVGQLVAGGLIEPDDVYTHPQRSQIYRSLGDKLNVQIDIFKQQVHSGDILLSCSDGLWEMVRNPQITDILANAPDPQTACSQLIEAANTNGGEDNVSAVVVFVR